MRVARRKLRGMPCYYHLYNRVCGRRSERPFGDEEKTYAFNLIADLSRYFMLEVISVCWMGNHFHLVVYAPGSPPSLEVAAKRHNRYYADRGDQLDTVSHHKRCVEIAERMVDISFFMAQLQQRISVTYNRATDREGGLWMERFKSSILEGRLALWPCVKYLELNPLRAKLVADPGQYWYSSWGRYCQTGVHPFANAFVSHLRASLGPAAANWSARELYDEFRGELARSMAADAGLPSDAVWAAKAAAKAKKPRIPAAVLESQYWVAGIVIGGEAFVRSVADSLSATRLEPQRELRQFPGANGTLVLLNCPRRPRRALRDSS